MTPAISASKAQQTRQLEDDIQQNLPKFGHHCVDLRLSDSYWLSNEYPEAGGEEKVQLANSFALLPKQKSLSEYRIAALTGEGGLLQAFSELANSCDMTVQIDCDFLTLQFQRFLLAECRRAEKYTDKHKVLDRAIEQLQAVHPNLSDGQIEDIREQFECYTTGMKRNLFLLPSALPNLKDVKIILFGRFV